MIVDEFGKPLKRTKPLIARARYDAAQSNDSNKSHWSGADALSARAAHSPGVRKILRERSRYETANNSYCHGMLRTLTDYVIGTGPTLQVLTDEKAYNDAVETAFHCWCVASAWYRKLWTLRFSQAQDGEGFGIFVTNHVLDDPVKLDLQLIECDQFTDRIGDILNIRRDDGLELDDFGNVVAYRVLPSHPGDHLFVSLVQPEIVPATDVIHLFRVLRPGQLRGVPEVTPALLIYPIFRRFTLASIQAAEKAARLAGVIKSNYSPADLVESNLVDSTGLIRPDIYDQIELEASTFLTLPEGWDIHQLAAEHPSSQHDQIVRVYVAEMGRCLGMPFNIAAANSSEYNFASGRLDHAGWFKTVSIDQANVGAVACTKTFARWFEEASRIRGYLPPAPASYSRPTNIYGDYAYTPPHIWQWDGQDVIDPREAQAQATALQYGINTLPKLYARRGLDFYDELTSQAKALGVTLEQLQQILLKKIYGNENLTDSIFPDSGTLDEQPVEHVAV